MVKRGLIIIALILLTINVSAIKVITGDSITGRASSQQMNISISVVSLPANVSILNPENKTYITNTSLLLNYSSTGLTTWYNLDNTNNYTLSGPTTISLSEGSHTLYLYANNSDNNVSSESIDFYVNTTLLIIIYDEYKNKGNTTNFEQYAYEDLQEMQDIILENSYGKIQFSEVINVTADSNFSDRIVNLDNHTNISSNRIELVPAYLPNFNKQSTLWLHGLSYSNPKILKDGSDCGTCTKESYSGGTLKFGVLGFSVYSAAETPAPETPTSPGGGGGGTTTVPLAEIQYLLPELYIRTGGITLTIRQGDMKIEEIIINNTGEKIIKVRVYAINITDYVIINETEFEVRPGGEKNVTLEFLIPEDLIPDIYLGKIVVDIDGKETKIPVSINVISKKPDFEVRTKIPEKYLETSSGKEIEGIIEINNFRKKPEEIILEYGILDEYKNQILKHTETLSIEEFLELRKQLEIPPNLKPGNYLFYAKLTYKDQVYTSSSWFYIKEQSPLPYVIGACIVIGAIILYFLFRKKKPKKEKNGKKLKKEKK